MSIRSSVASRSSTRTRWFRSKWRPISPNNLLGLALVAGLSLAGPVAASEGLNCSGEGATVEVALGRLVVVGVLGAYIDLNGTAYSTGPERGEGTPIATGQAFGDDDGIKIDFVDPNYEQILIRLRLTYTGNEDEPLAGTVGDGSASVDITCMAG